MQYNIVKNIYNKNMIIIAVYLSIKDLCNRDAIAYVLDVEKKFKENVGDGVIYHIIPTRNDETKMELIYPPHLDTDLLIEALEVIKNGN
jgi:hypothetical protein